MKSANIVIEETLQRVTKYYKFNNDAVWVELTEAFGKGVSGAASLSSRRLDSFFAIFYCRSSRFIDVSMFDQPQLTTKLKFSV
ncbi:hypothetical protein SBOR_1288 [Sclerotinia borealis F-4128]|uniref:Uncharacterized protein n=1 Tax=Sclerotinia borealis (strain F-4128) TaxID=1432307 RepID=W9CUX0_SCLBF|nr:hypothetical protein SBOR_1288 [Sclerotinia borealis F-4128]